MTKHRRKRSERRPGSVMDNAGLHSNPVAEALGAEPRGSATPHPPATLLLILAMVGSEPAGSALAAPDETRYAEIPREMLATGDFVVPRLNGVPYFEKPPLLYWVNAASLRLFGETPWAARLPTRLAGLGTTLTLVFFVRSIWGELAGLAAAFAYLLTPSGFLFS